MEWHDPNWYLAFHMYHLCSSPQWWECGWKCQRCAWCHLSMSLTTKHPHCPTTLDPRMPFRKTIINISWLCKINSNNWSSLGWSLLPHSISVQTLPCPRHQDSTGPNPCPKCPYHTHPPPHLQTPKPTPTLLSTAPQCHRPLAHPHQAPHPPQALSTSLLLPMSSDPASSTQCQKKLMRILLQKPCALNRQWQVPLIQLPPPWHRRACRTIRWRIGRAETGRWIRSSSFCLCRLYPQTHQRSIHPQQLFHPRCWMMLNCWRNVLQTMRLQVNVPPWLPLQNIEVLTPLPEEKEKSMSKVSLDDSVEDEVGDTVDISLNWSWEASFSSFHFMFQLGVFSSFS